MSFLRIASNDRRCAEFLRTKLEMLIRPLGKDEKGVAYIGFWVKYGVTFFI